jgi:KUP system potassium uptake protein
MWPPRMALLTHSGTDVSVQLTKKGSLSALTLAALGVVYGDIGTSPLYTMKTVFSPEYGLALNTANVLGVVSLILWGLTLVVTLKYITLIMRADNHGEGGIIALLALALSSVEGSPRLSRALMIVGLIGTALFFGDGIITPAISVLGAVEGLEVAAPGLAHFVVPISVAIVTGLYLVQRKGTQKIGRWFGPVMVIWFLALAAMGLVGIVKAPVVLQALNPMYAFRFMVGNGWLAFVALGAIVLAFTGAEALYADLGHFGKAPIRLAWSVIVFPALALNYLGQGALLLADPATVQNPFYHQLGAWSIYPLMVLATIAAVIASQATISGTFSMVREAIALGLLPRMRIVHTSDLTIGQIYVPVANALQFVAVVLAVIGFGSSDSLASAYGIAVTMTMLATTILTFFVIRYQWDIPPLLCWSATAFFAAIDAALLSANALKIFSGGWFPLMVGIAMLLLMTTWKGGRQLLRNSLRGGAIPLEDFLRSLFLDPPTRVPGVAVFLRGEDDGVPHAMLHNLVHNKVLHAQNIFVTVLNADVPEIPASQRLTVQELGNQCFQVHVRYGFKEARDIPAALDVCKEHGLHCEAMETSYFISRQTVIPSVGAGMALWREKLFAIMSRTARSAADYYEIPSNRVIELGTQVEI